MVNQTGSVIFIFNPWVVACQSVSSGLCAWPFQNRFHGFSYFPTFLCLFCSLGFSKMKFILDSCLPFISHIKPSEDPCFIRKTCPRIHSLFLSWPKVLPATGPTLRTGMKRWAEVQRLLYWHQHVANIVLGTWRLNWREHDSTASSQTQNEAIAHLASANSFIPFLCSILPLFSLLASHFLYALWICPTFMLSFSLFLAFL